MRRSGIKTKLAGPAILSGYNAAKVLGVTSAKIRITSVNKPVAMANPASPKILTARTVAIADARIFTKLLPIRIKPIRRSGRASNDRIRRASFEPSSARFCSFTRLIAINPVSELEKKPDRIISISKTPTKTSFEISLKTVDRHTMNSRTALLPR